MSCPNQGQQAGPVCALDGAHAGACSFKCCAASCPGYTYAASQRAHPCTDALVSRVLFPKWDRCPNCLEWADVHPVDHQTGEARCAACGLALWYDKRTG